MAETAETSVAALVEQNKSPAEKAAVAAEKPRITVVTNENVNEYVAEQLGLKPAAPAQDSPEAKAAAEHEKNESEKKAKAAAAKAEEIDHPEPSKKTKLNERFSEITEARKKAEAEAEEARKTAKEALEAREAAERAAAELRAKYEPAKTDELGPEPQPEQFADAREYGKAVKDWSAEKALRDAATEQAQKAAKARADALIKGFQEREEAHKKSSKDYADKIAKSSVVVSNEMQAAILESEVGPAIMEHLADNPNVAKALREMPTARMLREFGKLEVSLSKGGEKTTVTPKPEQKAEISRAPAPISPLSGSGTGGEITMNGGQEFHGTYEEYKAKRRAGQIK